MKREVADQAAHPIARHRGRIVRILGRERQILLRWDAEAVESRRQLGQRLDQRPLEHRGEHRLEQALLLLGALCLEQGPWIGTMQAASEVRQADRPTEHAVAVETVGEALDPPLALEVAALPVAPGRVVEMRLDALIEDGDVLLAPGFAEETEEIGVIVEQRGRLELQPEQGQMRRIEIDCDDPLGLGQEVAHDVAAAGRDGRDPRPGCEVERGQVDLRILPDLRVDEAREDLAEQALEKAAAAVARVAARGGLDQGSAHGR